ncbi:MAG: hypothetical protein ACFE9L_11605 [Candidatus Hodarchaeota archaeon]
MNQETQDILKNVAKPISIYLCLAVFSFLILPSADFTRTLVFLTGIFAAFSYKNEFEEILLICFGSPMLTRIVTTFLSIILGDIGGANILTQIMSEFVMMIIFILVAGLFGICVNIISGWLSGFLTARTEVNGVASTKNIFTVLSKYSENEISNFANNDFDYSVDSFFVHTDRQVVGILSTFVILLMLSGSLLILPMYDYSFDNHLTVWSFDNLSFIPFLFISLAVLNLLSLITIVSLWRFYPKVVERFPSSFIDFQSKFCVLGIFFASAFFPTPSSIRVDSFTVEASIGIEILTYVIGLLIIVTPSIIEFFKPLTNRNE